MCVCVFVSVCVIETDRQRTDRQRDGETTNRRTDGERETDRQSRIERVNSKLCLMRISFKAAAKLQAKREYGNFCRKEQEAQ